MRGAFRLMPSCVSAISQASISIARVDIYLQNETSLSPNAQNSSFSSVKNGVSQNGSESNGSGNPGNNPVNSTTEEYQNYSVFLKHCTFTRIPGKLLFSYSESFLLCFAAPSPAPLCTIFTILLTL